MAAAPDPDEVFRSSKGRDNFQRLARLLISGGTVLLREVFDVKCPQVIYPQHFRIQPQKSSLRQQSSPNHSGTPYTLLQGRMESQQTLI